MDTETRTAPKTAPVDLSYGAARDFARSALARDPMDSALGLIAAGTLLFYLAEKDANPKVRSLADAAVFVTTCMSVGYSDIFAKTPAGKAIASVLMTVGPSLAARLLDPPRRE